MSLDKIILELGLDNTKFVSGLSTAERRMMRMSDKIGKSMGTAERSWKTFEKAIERSDKGLQQLRSSLDPTYAAMKRYEQAQKQVAQALAYNTISQKEANQILAQARSAYGIATAETKRFGAMTRQMRSSVQNASFQISDMAVQLEMGTNPMRVMSQQIPQLLGGFGAMGAAIGTVVAVGLPLANMFFQSGSAADDASKSINDLASALSASRSAFKLAIGDAEALQNAYGEATETARSFALNEAKFNLEKAAESSGSLVTGIINSDSISAIDVAQNKIRQMQESISDFQSQIDKYGPDKGIQRIIDQYQNNLKVVNSQIDRMADRLGLSRGQLESLKENLGQIDEIVSSQNFTNVDDINNLRDALTEINELYESSKNKNLNDLIGEFSAKSGDIIGLINHVSELREKIDETGATIANLSSPLQRVIAAAGLGDEKIQEIANSSREVQETLENVPPIILRMSDAMGVTANQVADGYNLAQALSSAFDQSTAAANATADAASGVGDEIYRAADAAQELSTMLASAANKLAILNIKKRFVGDKVGEAGALARYDVAQIGGQLGGYKGAALAAEQGKAYVEMQKQIAQADLDLAEARKQLRSASGGRGGGGGRGRRGAAHAANEAARAAERQAKAYEALTNQLDPMMAQMGKYREQLALINEQAKTQEEREKMVGLLDQQRDKALLGSEYDDYESELTKLNNWYTEKSEIINGWREQELLTADAHYRMMNEIERRYAEHRRVALLDGYGAMLGTLTGLVKGWAGEQSDAYRAAAAVEKSWALFSVAAKAQPAMAQEWNSPEHTTFFQRLAASAAVGAKFGLFQQIVASLTPGFAAGGVVPGSSISGDNVLARLNSKEMVLTQTQQARLFRMANGREGGGSAQQPVTVINTLNSDEIFANVSPANLSAMVKNEIASNPSEYRQILQ